MPGVYLYTAEVRHVDQSRLIPAEKIDYFPALRLGAERCRLNPWGDDPFDVLLEEALSRDAVGIAAEGFRPALQIGEDEGRHAPVVLDHVTLRVPLFGPEHLVQVRKVHLEVVDGNEPAAPFPRLPAAFLDGLFSGRADPGGTPVDILGGRAAAGARLEGRGKRRLGPFPSRLGRFYVLSQAKKDGLAHETFVRPAGEGDLADELRRHPCDAGLHPGRLCEGRLGRLQLLQALMKLFELFFREAAARVAYIDELSVIVYAKDQRAEAGPPAFRPGEADYDRFLAHEGFDLEPFPAPAARSVRAGGILGDYALRAVLPGSLEETRPLCFNMVAEPEVGKGGEDLPEDRFP